MHVQRKKGPGSTDTGSVEQSTDASTSKNADLRGMSLEDQEAALSPNGAGANAQSGGDPTTDGPTWASVVCKNFPTWDANGDGRITIVEANTRMVAKKDKGEDYSALRGLVYFMKDLAALSDDDDKSRGKHLGMTEKDLDVYAQTYPKATTSSLNRLQKGFTAINKKLGAEKDFGLYGKSGQPNPKLLHQGAIGTCYFLAPLISLAERDPNAICSMIVEHPGKDGTSYTVTFPGQTPVTVTLGDDELRRQQAATDDGVWASVMERAFIAHNWEKTKGGKDKAEIKKGEVGAAEGGFGKDTIELLTGNEAKRIMLKGRSEKKITELLEAAWAKGALMTCGINKQWWKAEKNKPLPDGHEYALIGYAGGDVTIRNPHGSNTGGELMDKNGAAKDGTDDAEFTIDVATFKKMFSDLSIEQK